MCFSSGVYLYFRILSEDYNIFNYVLITGGGNVVFFGISMYFVIH